MLYDPNASQTSQSKNTIHFYGNGGDYFRIMILNLLLTLVTLGLYYPWAKAARRRYIWNEFELNGSRLIFNGTGREMFRGFIILYVIVITLYFSTILLQQGIIGVGAVLILELLLFASLPLAIMGSFRYRITRTSWRGVYFGFDGKLGEFYKLFLTHGLLVFLTFGIYIPWFYVKVIKYLFSHVRAGDIGVDFEGDGMDLLFVNIVGAVLCVVTLNIYLPIFMKERYEFLVNNVVVTDRENRNSLYVKLNNGDTWVTIFTNAILTFITLGIYTPWSKINLNRLWINSIQIPDNIDLDRLEQTQLESGGSTADQLIDAFDLDIGF